MTLRNLMSSVKWMAIGAAVGALVLWKLWRQKPAPAQKKEVEAAVEREKADAVKAEPVPTDLNEVKRRLRDKGLIN